MYIAKLGFVVRSALSGSEFDDMYFSLVFD